MKSEIEQYIRESISVKEVLLADKDLCDSVTKATVSIIAALRNGNKVLFCGNGGSAADAQHLAAELSGRFYFDRPPLDAEALHVNTSYLTAVANDYSFDVIYSRLVEAKGRQGDVLVGLSTSGNSRNIVFAFEKALSLGMKTIGLTGASGGVMRDFSTHLIAISSTDTPRIQECHIMLGHFICYQVEKEIFRDASSY